ncbi:MAG: hypothetical protein ACFBRM_03865 [Pikeienuella sp.]
MAESFIDVFIDEEILIDAVFGSDLLNLLVTGIVEDRGLSFEIDIELDGAFPAESEDALFDFSSSFKFGSAALGIDIEKSRDVFLDFDSGEPSSLDLMLSRRGEVTLFEEPEFFGDFFQPRNFDPLFEFTLDLSLGEALGEFEFEFDSDPDMTDTIM